MYGADPCLVRAQWMFENGWSSSSLSNIYHNVSTRQVKRIVPNKWIIVIQIITLALVKAKELARLGKGSQKKEKKSNVKTLDDSSGTDAIQQMTHFSPFAWILSGRTAPWMCSDSELYAHQTAVSCISLREGSKDLSQRTGQKTISSLLFASVVTDCVKACVLKKIMWINPSNIQCF